MMKTIICVALLSIVMCDITAQNYRQHQPVLLNFEIESTSEKAIENPFLDYRLQVVFKNEESSFSVPGFYAADGNAGESGANEGGIWRVMFTPNQPGDWRYEVSFKKGRHIAVSDDLYTGEPVKPHDGATGSITVEPIAQNAQGFEKIGRVIYSNSRYLHTENGHPLLKFGANSPENILAYADFDGTYSYDANKKFLKTWTPHIQDWQKGDPIWHENKGKGIIGALNYLAAKGMNAVYALTMNIGGDARDVWPFLSHNRKDFLRYDVSKLAQWDIVFSHAERKGIIMHLITQETENELLLDDGFTLLERKLYYRELVARFSYHKNIIWNMGEENGPPPWEPQGQNDQQRLAMIRYLSEIHPYKTPIVIHTHPSEEMRQVILKPLIGYDNLDGLSMQVGDASDVHSDIKSWIKASQESDKPWIVMMDEIGPWHTGTKTDKDDAAHDKLRQDVLWGTLMAGGAGVEWYFGWEKPPHDLNTEDWRSRNNIWEQSATAHNLFKELPYTEMNSCDQLLQDDVNYCFSKPDEIYVIYIKQGGTAQIDLKGKQGEYSVNWYNPRIGGKLVKGTIATITAGGELDVGRVPSEQEKDWVVVLKRE